MTTQPEQRSSHPYYMYDMIRGEASAVRRMLDEESDSVAATAELVGSAKRVHIVGIGTSWHASLVGEFLLRTVAGRDEARAWNSFEFCAYPPHLNADDVVIVMSHRGTKQYSAQALELARNAGAKTVVFSGIGSSARSDLANVIIRTSIPDQSSAFTISHTSALAGLAMLSAEVGASNGRGDALALQQELRRLPELLEAAFSHDSEIRLLAQSTKDSERFYFAGWGPNASTAYEVALKIKESSYLVTEGFQLEQYLHGPFVATHPGCVVIFIVPPGVGRGRTINLINATNETGAHTVAIVDEGDSEIQGLVNSYVSMPPMSEALTPIVYLTPLQLFTYWLAVEANRNPDVFRLDDPNHQSARQKYEL